MSVNDGLMEGGAPNFKFEAKNDEVEGVIDSVEKKQQTEFGTNKPLTWPDGNPKWQFVFTLATGLRDNDDDDGLRRVFARGQMLGEVRKSIRESKYAGDVVGGTLKVRFVGTKPSAMGTPAKQYRARFTAPSVDASSLTDGGSDEAESDSGDDGDSEIPFS